MVDALNTSDLERNKFVDKNAAESIVRTASFDSAGNDLSANGVIDTNNSSHEVLLAGATFTGVATDILAASIVYVTVYSDQVSATDGLVIEQGHSENGVETIHWDSDDKFTIPASTGKTFSIQPALQYIRVKYTNGGVNQTEFRLHVVIKHQLGLDSSHRIQDAIVSDDDARLVKAVLTAKKPDGTFINIDSTAGGNLKSSLEELESGISVNSNTQLKVTQFDSSGNELGTALSPTNVSLPSTNFDSFGRFAVAAPHKLFETGATQVIDETRYHTTSTTGSGTVTRSAQRTQIDLATTTASGDKAVYQTRRNIQYNKANAQEIFIIYKANPLANRRERWGYFNDNNGVYFEHDGTDPRLVIRSDTSGSVVNTAIERASWDDPLDGTGSSGLTIDFTNQTVYKIDFGWLSSRGVRFFADIGGTFVLVKQWYISNQLAVPFMAAATLPVRFEVENTDTTAQTQTSSYSCCAVQSSGSAAQEGSVRYLSNGVTPSNATTTEAVIAGIRLNSTYADRGSIQPLRVGLLSASGTDFAHYKVIYNPTLTGASWTTASEGIHDYISTMPSSFTGGSVIAEGTLSLANKNQVSVASFRDVLNDVYLGTDLDGSTDPLVVTVQTNTGSGTVFYNAEFKEFT